MSKLVNWVKNYGKKTGATRVQCSFRLIAGGYLVYIAYNMAKELITGASNPQGWARVGCIAAIVLFGVFGLGYFLLNVKVFLKKDFFVPGRDDVVEDEARVRMMEMIENAFRKLLPAAERPDERRDRRQQEHIETPQEVKRIKPAVSLHSAVSRIASGGGSRDSRP